jgi:hypothetical protein
MYWLMNKKSKLSVENKLFTRQYSTQFGHTALNYGDAVSHPTQKYTSNLPIKNSQDDNQCPLACIKSNIA